MATGGTSGIRKDCEGQKYSVRRFAYDVLYITLSKCGIPETHLEVKLDDKKNNYRRSNYVISVHYAVICIALSMRDQWKHIFKYKQKSSGLNDMRKVEKYLANIEELLEFRRTDELEKIRKSLAFYSELILFLHYNNLDVDFGKLLDLWSNYFTEKIAVNYESDVLLETVCTEKDVDFRFVDGFLENVAKPYGKQNYVSEKFKDIYEGAMRSKCQEEARADVEKLTREFGDARLESTPQKQIDVSSQVVKKSVSFSAVPEKDSALSGSLASRGQSIRPRIVFSTRPNVRGAEFISKTMNIISKETPQEREDQGSVLPDHRKYFEKPSAMAAGEELRKPKNYEGQKYSIRRFAYDVLNMTLSKCGFPKTRLQVEEVGKENNYHYGYVMTVYSAVICNALTMRDKWKRMFEYKQKSRVLNDMEKVEEYLVNIEVLPEFGGEGELYKIWRSLAFYSELILFLHHNNLEVNFEKFLDIWSNYFYEKIAVNHEPDVLLEGLFITDRNVACCVNFLDGFLQETAIPYGKIADVSKRFQDLSLEVEKFYEVLTSSVEERKDSTANPSRFTPQKLSGPIPEDVEE